MNHKTKKNLLWCLFMLLLFVNIITLCLLIDKSGVTTTEGEPIKAKAPVFINDTIMTEIPGYTYELFDSENSEISLINPEHNQVFFQYEIMENGSTIHQTKLIPPGKMSKVNMVKLLDKGVHDITLHIKTYDLNTKKECNAVNIHVSLEIK